MIALFGLSIASYTDFKERNIYIYHVCIQGIIGIALTAIDMSKSVVPLNINTVLCWLIMPILFGISIIVLSVVTKGEIGIGDGCECIGLGLVVGIRECIKVLSIALIVCGMAAAIILTNKAEKKKTLPFVPFLLAGFMLNLLQALL